MTMYTYKVIADVGNGLLKMLRSNLVPNLINTANGILLASPQDRGDAQLSIYLYDIEENLELRNLDLLNIDASTKRKPPIYLNLYYMVTAYSSSDVKYKAMEEQKILGAVVQTFYDNGRIEPAFLNAPAPGKKDCIDIALMHMPFETKQKCWNVQELGYKTSLFYKVSPVPIDSGKGIKITRVVDAEMEVES